jgi:N-methylhydantoinase A
MIRASKDTVIDVGPRSAHIAGCEYACFASSPEEFQNATLEFIKPAQDDPSDYVIIRTDTKRYALTLTCVSNALGYVNEGDYAYANQGTAKAALSVLARYMGKTLEEVGRLVVDATVKNIQPTIRRLIEEYGIPFEHVELTGGGGGCATVVPIVAEAMDVRHKIARNHQYISPIGAALAMVRDTVERTIIDPSNEDIMNLRNEALQRVVKSGAVKESVEVTVDIDTEKNIVRATATGSTDTKQGKSMKPDLDTRDLMKKATENFSHIHSTSLNYLTSTNHFSVYQCDEEQQGLLKFLRRQKKHLLVLDRKGTTRLRLLNAEVKDAPSRSIQNQLKQWVDVHTKYDVGGEKTPDVFLLIGNRVIDFTGVPNGEQMVKLINTELSNYPSNEHVILLGCVKSA